MAAEDAANALNAADGSGSNPTVKTSSGGNTGKDNKDSANDSDSEVQNANPLQTLGNQQPIAAAIALNANPDTTPAVAATTSAAHLTIAGVGRPQAKVTLASAGNEDDDGGSSGDTKSATTQPASSAGTAGSGTTAVARAAIAAASTNQAQSSLAQNQTDTSAVVLAQADAVAQGNTDHAAAHADSGTTATAAAGGTAGPSVAGSANFPAFGLLAANAATTATGTPASTSPTAAVPIAGLAVEIASRAQAGGNQFDIRLDPPELGRIDVRLGVDGNGQVTTHVTVERADTLQLLQSQQPQLERALEQSGLKTADNGLQFTLRDQSFAGQNGYGAGQQQQQQQTATQLVIPDASLSPVDATPIYSRLNLGSGIDIRV